MSDLISRQAAIDELNDGAELLRRVLDDTDVVGTERAKYEWGLGLIESYISDMEELPSAQPEQRWTPVSEGLPRENGWYQCTVIVNDLPRTTELFYKNDKWLNNQRIGMFNTYDIYGYGHTKEKHKLSYQELISEFDWTENVVAWMPLPEPSKEE